MSFPAKKLRILCLHGYYNNVDVMRYQMDFYMTAFKDFATFEFLNGVYEIDYEYDPQIAKKFEGPFYGWGNLDMEREQMTGTLEATNYVIDYINNTGPYDGVLGFSQGCLVARLLLKNKELRQYCKKLDYPLNFGILVAALAYYHLNPFHDRPEDYEILHTKYEQPLFYLYGKNDPLIYYIEKCVVPEGEYSVFLHGGKHKIPRLIGSNIEPLLRFISKRYWDKYKSVLVMSKPIDKDYEIEYMNSFQIPLRSKI
ncbi:unnamed protein product [Moneuplotes crassus]|uniref:Serine hydrolase domain-containing protein n=1 Tax=Euplotes crassus TaxID=5936 RepID=A0AAD1XQL4_EUPCR|nr:unnamed protein product [Moneuplotes crassus]